MFGAYGIYSNGKLFALVCDNKLYIKATESGRVFIKDVVEAPPYPDAKPSFLTHCQMIMQKIPYFCKNIEAL